MRDSVELTSNFYRDHVKHDLDPYVCLFEPCNNSNVLYKHSEDWLKHMRQHNLRWRCTAKAHGVLVFDDKNEYEQHMKTAHKGSRSQLSIIAARSSRSAGPVFESCPLCGESGSDGQLDDHVAIHLRYLALKSLPFPEFLSDYQDSESQEFYSDASMGGRRSTFLESFEDGSPSFNTAPEKLDCQIEGIGVVEPDASGSPKSDQVMPPQTANTIDPLLLARSETGYISYKPFLSIENLEKTKQPVFSFPAEENLLQDEASLSLEYPGLKSEASKGSLDDIDEYTGLPMPSSHVPAGNVEKDKAADLPYHAVSRSSPQESVEPEIKRGASPRNSPLSAYPTNQKGHLDTSNPRGGEIGGGCGMGISWYCSECKTGPNLLQLDLYCPFCSHLRCYNCPLFECL